MKITDWFLSLVGKIKWPTSKLINTDDLKVIHDLLVKDYYIILTRRSNHLSTFFIGFANFVLTRKWGHWSHSLMNLEDEVKDDSDFRLIESTSYGVHYTPFEKVFDVSSVALLKPKKFDLCQWTGLLDKAKSELGKPYDTLFNLKDNQALSCVELVRTILMDEPNYLADFAEFEKLIATYKNLTPQMFFDCADFEVVYLKKV